MKLFLWLICSMNENLDGTENVYGTFMMLMKIIIFEKMHNTFTQWKKLVLIDERLEITFELMV